MTGGAPILCPDPTCDTGMLEDYHPAEERDDVFQNVGYVGHCTYCGTAYYIAPPRPVRLVPDAQEMDTDGVEP